MVPQSRRWPGTTGCASGSGVYSRGVPVTAVVPIKALSSAKERLSGALTPNDRQSFVAWMASRVIAACQACEGIDTVLVVAGDEAAADIARRAGAQVLVVAEPGLDAAMRAADAVTADAGATIVVAADLPQAGAVDLQAVLDAAPPGPCVVIAPTADGGTGALYRRPAGVVGTAYGPGSAAAHAALGKAAGVQVLEVHRPALADDVDRPEQLPGALALASESDVGCRPR